MILWRITCVRVNYRGGEGGEGVGEGVQPFAMKESFVLNLQSESHAFLFDETWQKRPRKLDDRMRLEEKKLTIQMQ